MVDEMWLCDERWLRGDLITLQSLRVLVSDSFELFTKALFFVKDVFLVHIVLVLSSWALTRFTVKQASSNATWMRA